MKPYSVEEIKEVRSKTPDTDPWEARAIDSLLAAIDGLEAQVSELKAEMNHADMVRREERERS